MTHKSQSFTVPPQDKGKTISAFLRSVVPAASWSQVKQLIQRQGILLNDRVVHDVAHRLAGGERVSVGEQPHVHKKQAAVPGVTVVYYDYDVVVVDKPAGLTTIRHPDEIREYGAKSRFLPPTLADMLPRLILKQEKRKKGEHRERPVKAVHRLDKETSGLLVFARTASAASHLGRQFRAHSITRVYTALVIGHMADAQRIESRIARDRGDGIRGSHPTIGKQAVTHITVKEHIADCSLIECRLETGRTHQIRIHVAEKGYPICGETVYLRRFKKRKLIDPTQSSRLALHASTLGFHHPHTGQYLEFNSPLPSDLKEVIEIIRKRERKK